MASREPVVVAGGAGYIGSHTCLALQNAGFEPIVIDNLSEGHDWLVQFGDLERADIGDAEAVRAILRRRPVKHVLCFAAYTYVGVSVIQPRVYFENNVTKLNAFLGACLDSGVQNFVFSSSCATYGNPLRTPLDESHPQNPISPYGETKLMGERLLKWYGNAYGLNHISLRYFNACGASSTHLIGEAHHQETHLIPLILRAALKQREHISIFGNDYPTPDGTCIRDFIHVDDLATAHVMSLLHLINGGESDAINLGTGIGYSVEQVISAAESVTGASIKRKIEPRRAGDPPVLYADSQKSLQVLKWKPVASDLEHILHTAWKWEQYKTKMGL